MIVGEGTSKRQTLTALLNLKRRKLSIYGGITNILKVHRLQRNLIALGFLDGKSLNNHVNKKKLDEIILIRCCSK